MSNAVVCKFMRFGAASIEWVNSVQRLLPMLLLLLVVRWSVGLVGKENARKGGKRIPMFC